MLKRSEDTMGEREMFLVLAAMLFFSMTSLSVNNFCINNNETMMKSEFDYYAISLAQGIIEEAKTRSFDAALVFGTANNIPEDFNNPGSMGHAWNESYPRFNDVDDYHGLTLNVTTPRVSYTVSVRVVYVEDTNLAIAASDETYYKRMTVSVTGDYISSPIILSHVFSYYDFGS